MPESITLFLERAQSPTLGISAWCLIVVSLASQLAIPDSAYVLTGFFLLIRIFLTDDIAIVDTDHSGSFLPAIEAALSGVTILLISRYSLDEFADIKGFDAPAAFGPFLAASKSKPTIESSIHCFAALAATAEETYQSRFASKADTSKVASNTDSHITSNYTIQEIKVKSKKAASPIIESLEIYSGRIIQSAKYLFISTHYSATYPRPL